MERNKSLDGLKYLLIVLVIIGHCIEPSRYTNPISSALYSVIYAFHMPLFIFLSGYFYRQRSIKEEVNKTLPFVETVLVCGISVFIIKGDLSFKALANTLCVQPLWYLVSLAYWRMGTSLILYRLSIKHLFCLSLIVEILMFFLPASVYGGGLFSIMRTGLFYPIFLLGFALKGNISCINSYKKWIAPLGVMSFIYILYTTCRLQHLFMFRRESFWELLNLTDIDSVMLYLFRYSIIVSSIFFSALILLYTYKNPFIGKFSQWGQHTLFIYFAQTILMPWVHKYISDFALSLLVSIIITISLTYLSSKSIAQILMNPISKTASIKSINRLQLL